MMRSKSHVSSVAVTDVINETAKRKVAAKTACTQPTLQYLEAKSIYNCMLAVFDVGPEACEVASSGTASSASTCVVLS